MSCDLQEVAVLIDRTYILDIASSRVNAAFTPVSQLAGGTSLHCIEELEMAATQAPRELTVADHTSNMRFFISNTQTLAGYRRNLRPSRLLTLAAELTQDERQADMFRFAASEVAQHIADLDTFHTGNAEWVKALPYVRQILLFDGPVAG
jgi:hypothetical protein